MKRSEIIELLESQGIQNPTTFTAFVLEKVIKRYQARGFTLEESIELWKKSLQSTEENLNG